MGKVIEIGVHKSHGDKVTSVKIAEALQGKGLLHNNHFKENNDKKCQLTLIEIENINYYNNLTNNNIQAINFRRNIITEGIKLNGLVGKEFFVGSIKVKGHDLCRPCKYLENKLVKNDIVKLLLLKSGLRCEILSSGKISVGDIIKY